MKWFAVALCVLPLAAQVPSTKSFVGTVVGFRTASAEIEIKPDAGVAVVAKLSGDTLAQKIAPGEKDLKKAQPIAVTDVAVGDRVLATLEPGGTTLRRLVVMPANEIARRNEADTAEWRQHGIAGIVAAKTADRITVKVRSMAGETDAVVKLDDHTTFKRYAPDSVKFRDAKPSQFAELSVGDQLWARGEKSADGLTVAAREIVSGTFLVKAGTIAAISPETRELTVKELGSNKPLTVVLTTDSQIKEMPGVPAGMMGAAGRGGMPPPSMPSRGGHAASDAPARGGLAGGGPGSGFDINQMIEHMPAARFEDIKPGTTVVISATKGGKDDRVTAVLVLSNAGMLIQMASAMSGGGRGGAAQSGVNGAALGGMSGGDVSGILGGLGLSGIMQ